MKMSDWGVIFGRIGLSFGGTDECVTLTSRSQYAIGPTNGFTVSAWVSITAAFITSNGGIVSKRTSFGVNDEWNLLYRGDGTEVNMGGNKSFTLRINGTSGVAGFTIPGIVSTRMYNVIATATPAGLGSVYVDGVIGSVTSTVAPLAASASPVTIGALNAGSTHVIGGIDDVRIYNRVLTQSEIKLLSSSRGIAYEMNHRRSYKSAAAPPASTANNLMLLGVG